MSDQPTQTTAGHVARLIAEGADPWLPKEIGPRLADDWTRHPDTDAKVKLWEVYLPLAERIIAEVSRNMTNTPTTDIQWTTDAAERQFLLDWAIMLGCTPVHNWRRMAQ
jgi:hypothetical protein